MKNLMAIVLALFALSSCVKSFTNEQPKFKKSLQEKLFVTYNSDGTPKMVADSGYRPGPDGKPVFQATGKPRFVYRKGFDTTVHFYPPAHLVRKWLGATYYYDWNLLVAILCFTIVALIIIKLGKTLLSKGEILPVMIGLCAVGSFGVHNLTQKPFNYSRENEKWLWVDDYRAELKRDSTLNAYWNDKWQKNEIIFTSKRKKK